MTEESLLLSSLIRSLSKKDENILLLGKKLAEITNTLEEKWLTKKEKEEKIKKIIEEIEKGIKGDEFKEDFNKLKKLIASYIKKVNFNPRKVDAFLNSWFKVRI